MMKVGKQGVVPPIRLGRVQASYLNFGPERTVYKITKNDGTIIIHECQIKNKSGGHFCAAYIFHNF